MATPDPATLGAWVLHEVLGRGGMGVVYRARRGTQEVALKTVSDTRAVGLHALRAEILALSRIAHPHVVSIVDHGEDDGVPWVAMELVEGSDLREVMTARGWRPSTAPSTLFDFDDPPEAQPATEPRGTLSPEVLTLMRQLCDALTCLHDHGLVHRDLKPSNVLVRGGTDAVLVDFGLAVQAASERESLQWVPERAGSRGYVAPEQVIGLLAGPRADLYALGVMLFELLTGCLPSDTTHPAHLEPRVPELLDATVARLLQLDPHAFRGYADLVASALVEAGAEGPVEPSRRPWLYRPRMVSREQVLDAVFGTLEQGRSVVIVGDTGAGRTRALKEVVRDLRGGARLALEGHDTWQLELTEVPRGAPLSVLVPLLARLATADDAVWTALGPDAALLATLDPDLSAHRDAELALDPSQARRQLFRAANRLAELLTADRPAVLAIDDLHLADAASLAWLAQSPLPFVATWSTTEAPYVTVVAEAVALRPLTDAEVAGMAADVLGVDETPAGLVEFLSTAAERNPLCVFAYMREAVDRGLIRRDPSGRWTFGVTGALPMPGTVQGLLATRMDRAGSELRELATWAALAGGTLDAALAATLTGWSAATLGALQHAGERARVFTEGSLTLTGRSLAESVEAQVPEAELPDRHRRLAEALSALDAPPSTARLVAIAYHRRHGGDPERAAAADLAAGHALRADFLFEEAEAHLMRVVDARGPGAFDAGTHVIDGILVPSGRLQEATELATSLIALAVSQAPDDVLGPDEATARYLWVLARYKAGHGAAAVDEARALVGRCDGAGLDATLVGRIHTVLGLTLWSAGRDEEALAIHSGVVDTAVQHGGERIMAMAMGNVATTLQRLHRYEEALEMATRALEIFERLDQPALLTNALNTLAVIQIGLGDVQAAAETLERVHALTLRTRDLRTRGMVLNNLGAVYTNRGQLAGASRWFREAADVAIECENAAMAVLALKNLVSTRLYCGELELARAALEQALALSPGREPRLEIKARWLERAEGVPVDVLSERLEARAAAFEAAGLAGAVAAERGMLARLRGEDASPWVERARAAAEGSRLQEVWEAIEVLEQHIAADRQG